MLIYFNLLIYRLFFIILLSSRLFLHCIYMRMFPLGIVEDVNWCKNKTNKVGHKNNLPSR